MTDWLPVIVAVLGSGGIAAAVVALLKVRPEAGQIVVTAAQGAVVVQQGVIEELNAELKRQRDAYGAELQRQDEKLQRAIDQVEHLRKEVEVCNEMRAEILRLQEALAECERRTPDG